MSWCSRAALAAVLGAGVGVVGTLGIGCVVNWWRKRKAVPREPAMEDRPKREERKLKLYHSYPFRSSRCAWLVHELGAEDYVEFIPVSIHGADAQSLLRYREVHPHGTLPALVMEDGSVMLESSAICFYLAEVFLDPDSNSLLPDPQHAMEYYNYVCYATSTLDHILEPLYMQLTHTPEEKRNQPLVDSCQRKFAISANILSSLLADRQYVCGDKFTAADCVVGYNVWWASVIQGGVLLREYPVLLDYLERLKARPGFEKTMKGKKPVKPSGGSL